MILSIAKATIYPGLAAKLEPYRITKDEDMPWVYQKANPVGRYLHSDWAVLKSTPRIETAYKIPLPFRIVDGNAQLVMRQIPVDYPTVPDYYYEIKSWWDGKQNVEKKWLMMPDPIHPAGQWSIQEAYINERWVTCYESHSYNFLGQKVVWYKGLKADPHPIDCMCWFPEASFSVKWGSKD